MKKTIRDLLILSIGYSRAILSNQNERRIIAIHNIQSSHAVVKKLKWLKRNYKLVSLSDILQEGITETNYISLTFDDGFASWVKQGISVLRKYKVPATFFVNSGLLGLEGKEWEQFKRDKLHRSHQLSPLNITDLRDIAQDPLFDIGGHTRNHIDLGKILSKEILEYEIVGDKHVLEEILGFEIRWFAYPFGGLQNISTEAVQMVKEAGYEAAVTIIPGPVQSSTDSYLLPRHSLDIYASNGLWQAWLNGGYDRLYRLVHRR